MPNTQTEFPPAGPELDLMVAREVCGWVPYTREGDDFTILHPDCGDAPVAEPAGCSGVFHKSNRTNISHWAFPIPPYSRDIAAAWSVRAQLCRNPRNFSLAFSPISNKWLCQFLAERLPDGKFCVSHGGSAEHESECVAICHAALRAVGSRA